MVVSDNLVGLFGLIVNQHLPGGGGGYSPRCFDRNVPRKLPKHDPFEPRHDKTNEVTVRPAKTQISLGIRPV